MNCKICNIETDKIICQTCNTCYICNIKLKTSTKQSDQLIKVKIGKLIRTKKIINEDGKIIDTGKQVEVVYCFECYNTLQKGLKLYKERKEGKHGNWLKQ